ncbi:MAG: 30S ribosomal protein S15, partial [Candidatus Bathyarchaeia archaeon]
MARIHTPRRGQSHSTRPVTKRSPSWCGYRPEEAEALILKLAKEGTPPDRIGMILRDQHGIPLVKALVDKTIGEVMKDAGVQPETPEDLAALLRRAG